MILVEHDFINLDICDWCVWFVVRFDWCLFSSVFSRGSLKGYIALPICYKVNFFILLFCLFFERAGVPGFKSNMTVAGGRLARSRVRVHADGCFACFCVGVLEILYSLFSR